MKLHCIKKQINCSIPLLSILLSVTSTAGHGGAMGPQIVCTPGKIYIGFFGGAGASNKIDISQYGTAFFTEAAGGPLAVNALGRTNSRTVGLVGGHIGYQWTDISTPVFNTSWNLAPSVELEGYYLSKSSFTGHDINNDTERLPEHDFLVKYPMSSGVFLTNAILNFNSSPSRYRPYIGAGIGAAVISVSHAKALQVAPPEPGINHYNAHPNDTESAFAAQAKVGLNIDLTQNLSLFAEYRGLYLAHSNFSFGSTVYAGHSATSNWRVEMDSQYYNTGAIGLHYTI